METHLCSALANKTHHCHQLCTVRVGIIYLLGHCSPGETHLGASSSSGGAGSLWELRDEWPAPALGPCPAKLAMAVHAG